MTDPERNRLKVLNIYIATETVLRASDDPTLNLTDTERGLLQVAANILFAVSFRAQVTPRPVDKPPIPPV